MLSPAIVPGLPYTMLLLFLLAPLLLLFLKNSLVHNLPPGPNILQNLANICQLVRTPHVAHKNLAKTYGPLMSFRVGVQTVVVASSPAAAEEILKTQNRIFSGRYMPSIHCSVPGIMRASITASKDCNPTWKFLRGIAQSCIFYPKAVESAAGIRAQKAMEMVEFLRTEKTGKPVNVEHVIFAALINVIGNVLASTNMFENGAQGECDRMMI